MEFSAMVSKGEPPVKQRQSHLTARAVMALLTRQKSN
jgi:hypothetical protein